MAETPAGSLDASQVARFSASAHDWWAPRGAFAPLHRLNPVRLAFIRATALAHFSRGGTERRPFTNLSLLDVGCGGGLVCEPMARLGFNVVGIDAGAESIKRAREHASGQDIFVDYLVGKVEDLAGQRRAWDVVLALEIIEHVTDPAAFLRAALDLVAPGGCLILSTLNRTLASLGLAKFAAEYLLRWAPAGTHDWRRFVRPSEAVAMAAPRGQVIAGPAGIVFDPLHRGWRRSSDVSVNYIMAFGIAGQRQERCR